MQHSSPHGENELTVEYVCALVFRSFVSVINIVPVNSKLNENTFWRDSGSFLWHMDSEDS